MSIDVSDFKSRITKPSLDTAFFKGVIYGAFGVGKTTLAATKKTGLKTLIANVEGGTVSVAGTGVDEVPTQTHKQMQELFVYLKTEGHKTYDLLVVDSLNQGQKFALADTLAEKVKANEARNVYRATQDDQTLTNAKMREWMWNLKSLPMHIIYITPEATEARTVEDGENVSVVNFIYPALTEKFRESVLAYADFVALLQLKKGKRRGSDKVELLRLLRLQSDGTFTAKVRRPPHLPPVPAYILDPTLDKLFAALRGEYKEEAA